MARLRVEIAALQDRAHCLKSQNDLLRARLGQLHCRKPYPWAHRLRVLWYLEYFGIARRRITQHLGIPRCSLYRWLHRLQAGDLGAPSRGEPANKTPADLARLIWAMFAANPHWGRRTIAMTIQALGVFIAASTVRNVLLRPRPRPLPAATAAAQPLPEERPARHVPARYPNHVWSVDRTRVWHWGVWPTWVLVALDHYSRKVMVADSEGAQDTHSIAEALQQAFRRHGAPKHLISDQESVFTSHAFKRLLADWNVRHRLGAVRNHGSIAVTERVIWTLKHEWLRRVPLIGTHRHLARLLHDFANYYNHWRPHMALGGGTPEAVWMGQPWAPPHRCQKRVPGRIESRRFTETRVTAYRLPLAA